MKAEILKNRKREVGLVGQIFIVPIKYFDGDAPKKTWMDIMITLKIQISIHDVSWLLSKIIFLTELTIFNWEEG